MKKLALVLLLAPAFLSCRATLVGETSQVAAALDQGFQPSQDYGGIVHWTPARVAKPSTVDELARAVEEAYRAGLRIVARGGGHATLGQSQSDGGLLVDMSQLTRVSPVSGDLVEVEAGATWREVLTATLPKQRMPPVVIDYLSLTVGGTLSVGGVGPTSFREGLQVDHVTELDLVTADGRLITCSPTAEPELFYAALGGLGQFGIIARATLRLKPAPASVQTRKWQYADLHSFIAAQQQLGAPSPYATLRGEMRFDKEKSAWTYFIEASRFLLRDERPDGQDDVAPAGGTLVKATDATFVEYADRVKTDDLPVGPKLTNPWFNVFLPPDDLAAAVASLLERLPPRPDVFGLYFLFPVRREDHGGAMRVASHPVSYLFSALRTARAGVEESLVANHHELHETLRARGGVRYPIDATRYIQKDWREHFGEAWPQLAAIKRRVDPRGLFGSDPGMLTSDADEKRSEP